MSFKRGSTQINRVRYGNSEIFKIYRGTSKIYEKTISKWAFTGTANIIAQFLETDDEGNLYACWNTASGYNVSKHNKDTGARIWYKLLTAPPYGLKWKNGKLYVGTYSGATIYIYDKNGTASSPATMGASIVGSSVCDIEVDDSGNLYLAGQGTTYFRKVSPTGTLVYTISTYTTRSFWLSMDRNGRLVHNLYGAAMNPAHIIYNQDGTIYGTSATYTGSAYDYPGCVYYDSNNNYYFPAYTKVCKSTENFQAKIWEVTPRATANIQRIAIDENGFTYVGDYATAPSVYKLSQDGQTIVATNSTLPINNVYCVWYDNYGLYVSGKTTTGAKAIRRIGLDLLD